MQRIRYPVADAGDGRAVSIQDAQSGVPYKCFGCRAPMVARRGTMRAWHFAHKPPLRECADPDGALHEAAKALIVQGFTDAQATCGEYRAGFACESCGSAASWNIAHRTRSIAVEQSVVEGTRSDIVVDRRPKQPLIIEVVVSHDIEATTRQHYEASGMPVLVVHPEWDTVAGLAHAVIADTGINVPSMLCPECQETERRRREELSKADKWAQSMLRDLPTTSERTGSTPPSIRSWQRDKFGREMYSHIRRAVHRNAVILRRLGFIQTKTKPWLFALRLPGGCGVVYANFGSTEEVAVWEDTSALIHWQLNGRSDAEEQALVLQLLQACRRAGADVRVSFYNQHLDQHSS